MGKSTKFEPDRTNKPSEQGTGISGSAMAIQDIYLPLNHLFNQAAKRAFQFVVHKVNNERKLKFRYSLQEKETDEVRYFGAVAIGERKIFDAAQKVANQVNFYAEQGYVTGVLGGSRLLLYELVSEPHQLEQWMVLSYVSLSPAGIAYLEKNPTKIEFKYGAVPANVDDV